MRQKLCALLFVEDASALLCPDDPLKVKLAEVTANVALWLTDCANKLDSCQLEKVCTQSKHYRILY